MSISCSRRILLRVLPPPDMPLDQAIYVPSATAIFGVRGGYIHKFNANTGLLKSKRRFSPVIGSSASLCYSNVDGTIWCVSGFDITRESSNNAAEYGIGNYIYRIGTLDSLPTIGTINVTTAGYAQFWSADGLYGLFESDATGSNLMYARFADIDNNNYILQFSPVTHTLLKWHDAADPYDRIVNSVVTVGNRLWYLESGMLQVHELNPSLASGAWHIGMTDWPVGHNGNGMCYDAGTNSLYYGARATFLNKVTLAGGTNTAINCGVANSIIYNVRRNPVTGLIFTANGPTDSVSWFTPPGATVYYKTGFDYPVDIVFTPTKAFAVQAGSVALKEIDTTAPTGHLP